MIRMYQSYACINQSVQMGTRIKDTTGSASIARTQVPMSSSIPSMFIMFSARTWSQLF